MNLLTFPFPRGAGTIHVQIPVSSVGLARVQMLLNDPELHELDFSIQGLTISQGLISPVLANLFDLEPEARFQCLLHLKGSEPGIFSITATVFEAGYEAHAITSLPLQCKLDAQGQVLNVSLI
ncbi:hypothetical protein [Deinococcus cellulosilyticus]|uniref:Uncharacterized protein n=1 Tax=Deinococcus cellulosilyticus (strain DSM 18568 / NBRC 106333 / KACC 11606 / 5516J-15) TaxID=1223518 RepID=A0A511MWL9_DEIC1|nr:hypothetical protein [Deinococcus cellulosilyticus]GEM44567.1 hypothetical protein DC3_02020 [Deinococcus cellulosilyticus NBRC 106333 = KACC 11606]